VSEPQQVSAPREVRRALIITTNFPPDAAVGTMRTLRLVRHLDETGWRVDVVTLTPESFRPGTVVDMALLDRVPPSVRVIRAAAWRPIERLGAAIRPPRRTAPAAAGAGRHTATASKKPSTIIAAARAALAIPDRETSWLIPAVAAIRRHLRAESPNVIYSSGPPFTAHLVGGIAAKVLQRPWVADFRDPWARAPWREDRFRFERAAWRILERAVVTRADAAIFVTEANRRDFAACYGAARASRFHLVANGCDVTDFARLTPRSPSSPFILLHAGSLYGARNPAPLLRGLANAIRRGTIDRARMRLRFVGRVGVPGVESLVHQLGLEDVVEFISHVPRQIALQQMADASALLIIQPVTKVSVPAKLYEYMAVGRPVLALSEPDGETASIVQGSGAGIAVSADDEAAIERCLGDMVNGGLEGFTPVAPRVFDGALRAQQIARILRDVALDGIERDSSAATVAAVDGTTPNEVSRP
jgi:glycosyltransferase involved in cell wall biosynthesis